MSEITFQQAVCSLEVDSILYIFSDGVYEIPKPDGTVLTFAEFVKVLTRPIPPKHADIDHIVHTMQVLGDSETFADDFSILRVTFA
ncbi:MAG: SpoIIE family protein phosphatase [Deltaproteobacteria bacterium]|nr:SpoIIE family protein phosphatase [Deltaproteobacteria bacterium]